MVSLGSVQDIVNSTLCVTALCSTCTDQLPMTEADTPPPRSWPPLFYFFSVGNRLIESICHLEDTRRSIITVSVAVIWTSWEFWEPWSMKAWSRVKSWNNSICHFLKSLPITFHLIQFLGGKSFLFWPNWFNYAHNRFLNWSQLSVGLKIIGSRLFVGWPMDLKTININICDASQKKSKIYILGSQSPFLLLTSDRCRGRSLDWRWRPDRFTSFATCYVTSVHTVIHYLHYIWNIHYLHSLGNVHYSHYF